MKYLAVTGFRSEQELDRYLYNYAEVVESGTTLEGKMWAVVKINDPERAQYQADRLASGMMAVKIRYTDYGAAVAVLRML